MPHKGTALPPTGLLCDMLRWPEQTRICNRRPRFSWVVNDCAPNRHQVAYQILVAPDLETLANDTGDLWDSGVCDPGAGWTTDASSIHVQYDGEPLKSNSTYYWKVRTWSSNHDESCWSEPQCFRTGELTDEHVTVRQRLVQCPEAPEAVVAIDRDRTFIDFGKAACGTVELTLTCPGGGEVEAHLGEVLADSHTIDREPGGSRRCRKIVLPVKGGTHTYTVTIPSDERNTKPGVAILMPDYIGEVLPFRYCEVVGDYGPILREHVRRLSVWSPFDDGAARFSSSSTVLNDVWELCHYSMKATSFCGVHVDGDRERIPYEADAYINQLGYYCCDRELPLSRYTHEYLITHPTWPTEWILFSVLTAWADYEYTGDPSSLAHYYPDLQAKALTALAREDGLISVERDKVTDELLAAIHFDGKLRNIVDWPEGERDGCDMCPINTVVNAFHYRALVLLGRIAETLGKAGDAAQYAERATLVKAAILSKLVDSERGLFVDGEGSRHCSLHANMFPLAFGLTPAEMLPTVTAFIRSKGMACSVYAAQFMLEALYEAGEADYALSLMTATCERSWASWIYDVGSTISLEAWANRFKPNQDWNHAWGAAPANIIPRYLMGLRPLEPGFGRILIHPQPGPLAYANLSMPTIRGPVTVRLQNDPGRALHLEAEIPANTSARVVLPRLGLPGHTVFVDGRPIEAVRECDALVVDSVGSGRHTLLRR